jgi:hypothetical protein
MAKRIGSQYDETSQLCDAHACAFDVAKYIRVPEAREQEDDEPIQCEACALFQMRRLGVI